MFGKDKKASGKGEQKSYICVQDCWQNKTRYRRGDIITAAECPRYFVEWKEPEVTDDDTEDGE